MKNIKLLAFVLIVILSACNKDDEDSSNVCDIENPLEDLTWLKDIKRTFDLNQSPQREQIIQYRYHGDDVFLIDACFQCPDAITYVRDCEGEIICEFGGIAGMNTCPDFDQDATNEIILYDN
jgi:hypothetical protein